MRSVTTRFVLSLLLISMTGTAMAQQPPYAANLVAPIGIEVDDRGWVWVAEIGTGNNDGRISVVTTDGLVLPVLEGLGSVPEGDGNAGTYHLKLIDDWLYFTNGMGTVTPDGYLLRVDPSGFTDESGPLPATAIDTVANVGAFASENGLPENNLYDLEPGPNGDLFLADAGANAIFRMDGQTGELSVLARLDPTPNPIPVGPPMVDAVPSNLLYDNEMLYVSTFSGFPFNEKGARIYEISMDGEVSVYQDSLSLVMDLEKDPMDGSLLVLQMGLYDLDSGFVPETGSLLKIKEGSVDTLMAGLLLPSGMHMAPDGDLFMTSLVGIVLKMPLSAATSVEEDGQRLPATFTLQQNYPNPFNPSTRIEFDLQKPGTVDLRVFNVQGREIATLASGFHGAGTYEIHWDAAGQPSGLYLYRLRIGGQEQSRVMALMK